MDDRDHRRRLRVPHRTGPQRHYWSQHQHPVRKLHGRTKRTEQQYLQRQSPVMQ